MLPYTYTLLDGAANVAIKKKRDSVWPMEKVHGLYKELNILNACAEGPIHSVLSPSLCVCVCVCLSVFQCVFHSIAPRQTI